MILCLYTIVQIVCLLPIRSFIYLTAKYIHGNSNTVSKSFCYTGSQRFNTCNLDRKAIHFANEVISGAICQTSTQSSRLIATTTCVPHCPIWRKTPEQTLRIMVLYRHCFTPIRLAWRVSGPLWRTTIEWWPTALSHLQRKGNFAPSWVDFMLP